MRSLDLMTDCEEAHRYPINVQKVRENGLNVLVMFEARVRAVDFEDGDESFSRRVIVEPVFSRQGATFASFEAQ